MPQADADVVRAHIEVCEMCTDAADAEEQVRVLIRRACMVTAPDSLRVRIRTSLTVRAQG